MTSFKLKFAVLAALGIISAQASATGLVNLPLGSLYTLCNTTGNFGSGNVPTGSQPVPATAGANNTCAIVPAPAALTTSPVANYTFVAGTNVTRPLVVNNIYTNSLPVTVGSVKELVFRKPAASAPVTATPMCIYAAQITMSSAASAKIVNLNNRFFEANDIARAGFAGLAVSAGYAHIGGTTEPVYRIGRTYTSVQHRALATTPYWGINGGAAAGTGYVALPTTGSTASINGVNPFSGLTPLITIGTLPNGVPNPGVGLANPTVAQQQATNNDNWIDFTFDVNALDDDGSTAAVSSTTYVQAACSTATPVAVPNAIRVRNTGQENSPFISISTDGFVPPGGTALPAPVVPF